MLTPILVMRVGALLAATAVILGAFAAHGLKTKVDPYYLDVFHTGVTYQMYHALALLGMGYLWKSKLITHPAPMILMLIGIIVFSGSLYALVLTGVKKWGMVTPLGGVAFIVSWVWLALAFKD